MEKRKPVRFLELLTRKEVALGRDGEGVLLASSGEKDSNAQGPARSRRVCSFIGVGFPWPLRFLVDGSSEKRDPGMFKGVSLLWSVQALESFEVLGARTERRSVW